MELQVGYSPLPLFFVSDDSRGVKGAASCLESISSKVIDSKGLWRVEPGRYPEAAASPPKQNTISHIVSERQG